MFLLGFGFPIRTGEGHDEQGAAKRVRTSFERRLDLFKPNLQIDALPHLGGRKQGGSRVG